MDNNHTKHPEHCGCGCEHDHQPAGREAAFDAAIELTERQINFLAQLGDDQYLPVAQFMIRDSRQEGFVTIALAPVFLRTTDDDLATVKETGTFLRKMENLGLITLDYDIPLDGYDYDRYKHSSIYKYFRSTVAEGASRPGFFGDTPVLELGSIALTEAGEKVHADHLGRKGSSEPPV